MLLFSIKELWSKITLIYNFKWIKGNNESRNKLPSINFIIRDGLAFHVNGSLTLGLSINHCKVGVPPKCPSLSLWSRSLNSPLNVHFYFKCTFSTYSPRWWVILFNYTIKMRCRRPWLSSSLNDFITNQLHNEQEDIWTSSKVSVNKNIPGIHLI